MHDDDFDPHAGQEVAAPAPGALVNVRELDSFKASQAAIERARQEADAIKEINDRETAGAAADAVKALREARLDADKARKDEKGPYDTASTAIQTSFTELISPVKAAEESLKDRILVFDQAERKAAEAEREREAEELRKAQEAENKAAEKQGRSSKTVLSAPPPAAPRGARGARAKASPRKVWEYEITDEGELPDDYVVRTPDRKKIRAHVEAGVVIPGVRAWQDEKVQVR